MKQQLVNTQKYKDVIREEKDLSKFVGTESNFDVDSALRTMVTYYECWQGHDPRLIDRISIVDEEITRHLNTEIVQDHIAPLMSVRIADFPNEAGYFMLWELSISDDEMNRKIIPIFVNEAFTLRPMAGKRIMEQFLDVNSRLTVKTVPNLSAEEYMMLEKVSKDFAYDSFVELKEKMLKKNQENYNKYKYALQLRSEAVEHIGIENIRKSRMIRIQKERDDIERTFERGNQIYPEFRLSLLVRLEA